MTFSIPRHLLTGALAVAIFYGAAHMPDLEERLTVMGYVPWKEREARWFRAIEVDMAQSAVSPAELKQMRRMIRGAFQR